MSIQSDFFDHGNNHLQYAQEIFENHARLIDLLREEPQTGVLQYQAILRSYHGELTYERIMSDFMQTPNPPASIIDHIENIVRARELRRRVGSDDGSFQPMEDVKMDPLNAPMQQGPISVVSSIRSERTAAAMEQARVNAVRRRAEAVADAAAVREAKAQDVGANAPIIAINQMRQAAGAPKPYDWKKKYQYLVKRMRNKEWTTVNRIDSVQKYKQRIWRGKKANRRLYRPMYRRSYRPRRYQRRYRSSYRKRRRFY
ncbi:hypothetical protein [Crucivirus-432]|nr:hypothetical protein [Crucivirus-432]